MLHTLAATIITAQITQPSSFELHAVEVAESDTGTEILALDNAGRVIGAIALYALDSGVMLSANFDDGYIDFVFDGERIVSVDGDLDPAELEIRAQRMKAVLPSAPSALMCTATVIAASASCAASVAAGGWTSVLVCPASIVVSVCACRGVIKKISGFDFSQCEMD